MNYEYHWWDLEDSEFKGVLYDTIGNFYLYDHTYENLEEFEKDLPHMAYTHLTLVRFDMLEQLFVDLRVVPQMIGVRNFPIKSEVKDINRYDWLKAISDLSLMRFSSIRDVSFHLVNQIFELELGDLELNVKNLGKKLKDEHLEVFEKIKIISGIGASIRDDRNERAHKGFSDLTTDDDQLFKAMSWGEAFGGQIQGYDLDSVYIKSCDELYGRVILEVENIYEAVKGLTDLLVEPFIERYTIKKKS